MTGSALLPRDSAAPRVWEVEDGAGAFSPNGDGSRDALRVSIRLSEPSSWTLRIEDGGGHERASASGNGDTAALTWAPEAGSVPDGTYRWTARGPDGWGNGPLEASGPFASTRGRRRLGVGHGSGAAAVFSPNGDGYRDTIGFTVGSGKPGSVRGTVRDASAPRWTASPPPSARQRHPRMGRPKRQRRRRPGRPLHDGLAAEDRAGNRSQAQARTVAVYGALEQGAGLEDPVLPAGRGRLAARSPSRSISPARHGDLDDAQCRRRRGPDDPHRGGARGRHRGLSRLGRPERRGRARAARDLPLVLTATDGTFAGDGRPRP